MWDQRWAAEGHEGQSGATRNQARQSVEPPPRRVTRDMSWPLFSSRPLLAQCRWKPADPEAWERKAARAGLQKAKGGSEANKCRAAPGSSPRIHPPPRAKFNTFQAHLCSWRRNIKRELHGPSKQCPWRETNINV